MSVLRACTVGLLVIACSLPMSVPDVIAQRRRTAGPPPAPEPPPIPAACVDFYRDVNHDWLAAHPPVRDMGSVSVLGELPQRAAQQQQALLEAMLRDPHTDAQRLLADLWASGLDEAAVEADGISPLAPLLVRINTITRTRDIAPVLAALHQVGIAAGFTLNVDPDGTSSPRYLVRFSEGDLGLPDPAYYLRDDPDTQALQEHQAIYIKQLLSLSGSDSEVVDEEVRQILSLETRLAEVSRPQAALRTPSDVIMVKSRALNRRYRHLRLHDILKTLGTNPPEVALANPEALAELDRLVGSLPPVQWKTYLRYRVIQALAPYLSSAVRDAEFALHGRILRGQSTPPSRQQQVLEAINYFVGPLLAHEYNLRYVPSATREAATAIALDIHHTLLAAVKRSTWLSEDGKTEIIARLQALRIDIAPLAEQADPANLPIPRPTLQSAQFANNILAMSAWQVRSRLRLVGTRPAEPNIHILAQQPVLAYDPTANRLLVSAAALQDPVWPSEQNLPARYGSYGALIAHQLSRAVGYQIHEITTTVDTNDDEARDHRIADAVAWTELLARLTAQYDTYLVPNTRGVSLNSARTAEENAADLAAVELAFEALSNTQSALDEHDKQTFFRHWAGLWREQTAPELAAWNASIQPHAPGQWRTNGPLANHPAFARTFGCTPGVGMVRPVDARIAIWNQDTTTVQ